MIEVEEAENWALGWSVVWDRMIAQDGQCLLLIHAFVISHAHSSSKIINGDIRDWGNSLSVPFLAGAIINSLGMGFSENFYDLQMKSLLGGKLRSVYEAHF